METTRRIVILLVLLFLTVDPARSAEKSEEPFASDTSDATEAGISNTRSASCLVKITSDPAVLPLNFETIDYLLHSSGVGGRAAREVLDVSPDQVHDLFTIEYVDLRASDAAGGIGIPPTPLGTGLPTTPASGGYDEEYDEYEYEMMMEMEKTYPPSEYSPGLSRSRSSIGERSTSDSRPASSSSGRSTSRSTSRPTGTSRYGTTTSSKSRPATGGYSYSYSRRPGPTRSLSTGSYYSYSAAPQQRTRTARTPAAPAEEQTYLFSLRVQLPADVKPDAEGFMHVLVANLNNALADAFDEYSHRLQSQLSLASEEAERAENDLRQKQDMLREISGSRILDRNRILADISSLRRDLQSAKMDHASDQVTIDATTKRIAEIQAKLQEQIAEDAVTKELQGILGLQHEHLQRTSELVKRGQVSSAELADAEEKLARARIELAQRREQLSKAAGGSLIESLNSEVADRSILTAQHQAYVSSLEKQLIEAEALLGKADDYELLSLKADIAKQNLQEALVWRDRMSRKLRMLQPPVVSVIGAE